MLSVVIPAFNEEANIGACLEALCSQTVSEPFEVIVVDNNSTDRTAEVAMSFAGRLDVRVVYEAKKGRGAARERGFRDAKGQIIFSTDADAVVPPNWMEKFLEMFRDKPEIAAVTGPAKIDELSPTQNKVFNTLQPILVNRLNHALLGHPGLSGFSFAIRSSAYERAGGFNRDTDALEDFDLAERTRKFAPIVTAYDTPVTFSARRFRGGLLQGTWQYVSAWIQKCVLRKTRVPLNDPR